MSILRFSNTTAVTVYGATECQWVCSYHLLEVSNTVVPIGRPLSSISFLLVAENGQLLNDKNNRSEIGQIHIGG